MLHKRALEHPLKSEESQQLTKETKGKRLQKWFSGVQHWKLLSLKHLHSNTNKKKHYTMDMPQGKHVKLKELTMNVLTNREAHKVEVNITGCEENQDNGPGYHEDYDEYLPKFDIESGVLLSKTMKTANDRTNSSLTSLCLEMS